MKQIFETIKVNQNEYKLNPFINQLGPNGDELRLSKVEINHKEKSEWKNGILNHYWIYTFKNITKNKFISLYFDTENKLYHYE